MKNTISILNAVFLFNLFFPFFLSAQDMEWKNVEALNTPYQEYSPTLSPDGRFIIFGSTRPGGVGDKDLWISYHTNDRWTEPQNLRVLNSRYHDQEPFLSYDGTMLLFSSDRDGTYGVGDLFLSFYKEGDWTRPFNLGSEINSRDSERSPSLSMDNQELFFSRMPVDYTAGRVVQEKVRIYTSLLSDSGWSDPVVLPAPVNVQAMDFSPRIMPDNRTLLFCSRRPGKGGFDIWKVSRKKRGDPWNGLTNLEFINTEWDEAQYTFTINGDMMYLASHREDDRKYDIYESVISEDVFEHTITLQGRVLDNNTHEPVQARIIVELFNEQTLSMNLKSAASSGRYSVTLPEGDIYSVTVESPGYMFFSRQLDLSFLKDSGVTNLDIFLHPLQKGEKFVIRTIYFDSSSYELRSDSKLALERILKIMNENPRLRIRITGHVARVKGGDLDPQWLSEKRAEEVKKYLVEMGIRPDRLETLGLGDSVPVGDPETSEGRAQSRRTEFEILEVD